MLAVPHFGHPVGRGHPTAVDQVAHHQQAHGCDADAFKNVVHVDLSPTGLSGLGVEIDFPHGSPRAHPRGYRAAVGYRKYIFGPNQVHVSAMAAICPDMADCFSWHAPQALMSDRRCFLLDQIRSGVARRNQVGSSLTIDLVSPLPPSFRLDPTMAPWAC